MDISLAEQIAARSAIAAASDDLLLTRDELAIVLGMSPGGVTNAVTQGRLPTPVRLFTMSPRWRLGDIRAFIKSRVVVAS